jgi:hypothetical protein
MYRFPFLIAFFLFVHSVNGQLVDIIPSPDQVQVETGDTFSVTISFQPDEGAQLTGADIVMEFDPTLLQVVSISQLPTSLLSFPTIPPNANNETGSIIAAAFSFTPASTDFDHLQIEFEAIAEGVTTVSHITDELPGTSVAFEGFLVTGSTPPISVMIGNGAPPDCAGVPGGTAFLDDCETCVGGTTGLEPCEADCEGVFGGTALPGSPCTTNDSPGVYSEDCICEPVPCNAEGGTLEAPQNRSFCVGTGTPVGINVTAVGASGTNQRWGLIDGNGDIIATRAGNSLFNLDAYPPGDYTIRYIRFENDVSLAGITNISQVSGLSGCFDTASNSIGIFLRTEPDGGTLSALSSTTVCAGQGSASVVEFEVMGVQGENSVFGILDLNDNNKVVNSQASPNVNFNAYTPGNYRVLHMAYQQGVQLGNVEFPSDVEGCFDISNGINVEVQACELPELNSSPNPTEGMSYVTFSNPVEEYGTLEVYDLSGRVVERLFEGQTVSHQEYRFGYDGSRLSHGIYLYRLTTESQVVTERFIVGGMD